MKLTDLNPHWISAGGADRRDADGNPTRRRTGVGIMFDCPCGCENLCAVNFDNPIDGGSRYDHSGAIWHRTGFTYESLTLTPSINRPRGCGAHFWIRDGEVVFA
ncbi:MAG: hypothetical protein IT336_15085 [Thermomicrobiales bacterium]|nr:hypothetical protein [Thermomicrobiales bacterium]